MTPNPDRPPDALAAMLREAIALHQRGERAQAEARYEAILRAAPTHFDALHLWGVARYQAGDHAAAARSIRQAIAANPAQPAAHSNLGLVLQKHGQPEAALACFDRALALKADDPGAHFNRGNALRALRQPAEALASYDRALTLQPSAAAAWCNRGSALRDLDRWPEALASYDRAIALAPDDADALCLRAIALQQLDRHADALTGFDRALAHQPRDAEAWYLRGNALLAMQQPDAALASYDRALALRPAHVEALSNRGLALQTLQRHDDALASYDRALALRPDSPEVLNNRGNALQELRRVDAALASYDRALALRPDFVDSLVNRGNVLRAQDRGVEAVASYQRALALAPTHAEALQNCGIALRELGRAGDAAACLARLVAAAPGYPFAKGQLLHAQMAGCDWSQYAALTAALHADIQAGRQSAEPFGFLPVSESAQAERRCAEIYAAARYPAAAPLWQGERYDHPKLRVGYVAGEFRHQATAILITELLERHDRDRFEVYAFDNGWDDGSELRRRIDAAVDHMVDISRLSDAEAAAAIHGRRIDILVNLNGYFGRARQGVFARRPAPVQVNYLGFPGTIGAPYIDYIVGDARVIPPGHEPFYTERVVRLPDSYQPNDTRRRIAADTPPRVAHGLPAEGFVFCCFNNNHKITPPIFDRWMRLLRRVEGSVLWLLEDNATAARNLRREAAARGVDPSRLVFAPRMPLDEHLARHRHADLFVDTLPHNAHTTASDALWAGLPVLTCTGATFAGRVATSLLHAVGLPELATGDLAAYEATALELAHTPARLAGLRATLAARRATHPLFDTGRFRRHLEAAYTTMVERQRRGKAPAAFDVPAFDGGPPLVSRPV